MTQPPIPPVPAPSRGSGPAGLRAVTGGSFAVQLVHGAAVTVGARPSTAYHQQTSGSRSDVAAGKTVVLQAYGRFRPDEPQGGGTLGAATHVAVLP